MIGSDETTIPVHGESGDTRATDRVLAWAERWRWGLFAFLGLLYALGCTGAWRLGPDSARYADLARSLVERGEFQIYEHYQSYHPGLPWLIKTMMHGFGEGWVWPAHAAIALFAGLGLVLVYRLFCVAAGRPRAVVVTMLVGLNVLYYEFAFQLLTDMPFLVGVLAVLVGWEGLRVARDREAGAVETGMGATSWGLVVVNWLLIVGGLALAVSMRRAMWVVVGALALEVAWQAWLRRSWRSAAGLAGALALVLVGFVSLDPRGVEEGPALEVYQQDLQVNWREHPAMEMAGRVLTRHVPGILESDAVQAAFMIELGPGLSTLGGLVLLGLGVGLVRKRTLWGLLVVTMVVAMVVRGSEVRYFLPILPLLGFAWWSGAEWVNRRLSDPWATGLFVAMLLLWCVPNVVKVGDVLIEQHRRPFWEHYKEGRYADMAELGRVVDEHVREHDLVLFPQPAELNYLSRRRVNRPERYTDERWSAPPFEQVGQVYVVLPTDEAGEALIEQEAMEVGPAVATVERVQGGEPWRLHPVEAIGEP